MTFHQDPVLLVLLQDSDFEENFSYEDFDLESEEDEDDDYIVEQDIVVPLQASNHITANISTTSSLHDLPTDSPSRVIHSQN